MAKATKIIFALVIWFGAETDAVRLLTVIDNRNVDVLIAGCLMRFYTLRRAPVRRKFVIPALLLIAVMIGGGLAFEHGSSSRNPVAQPTSPPVPIVAGVVVQHDVPIYMVGVGTVIAYNTDLMRAQILGQIVSINFTEGHSMPATCSHRSIRVPTRLWLTNIPRIATAIRRSS